MKNSIVFSAALAITAGTAVSVYGACTPAPDCASLGYTKTSCTNGGVRCPWDTSKMFCLDKKEITKADICRSQGYNGIRCDGSCSSLGNCRIDHIGNIQCARFERSYGIDGVMVKTDENGIISCDIDCNSACLGLPLEHGNIQVGSENCQSDRYTSCGSASYLVSGCSCVEVKCSYAAKFNYNTGSCEVPADYCTSQSMFDYPQPEKYCELVNGLCYRCR